MLLDAAAYKVRNSQFTNAGVVPVRQRRETLSAALNKAGAAVAKNVRDSLYAQISNIERRRVVPKPDLDRLNDALDVVETLTPRLQAAFWTRSARTRH